MLKVWRCMADRCRRCQAGTTAVEYTLLLALIVGMVAVTLVKLSTALDGKLQELIHTLGLAAS